MFERPAVLWLLVAAPLVAGPSLLALGAERRLARVLAAALRLFCFASLVMGLAGMRLPQRGARRRVFSGR